MARIGIIGCGWLGKSLALHLQNFHDVSCYSRRFQDDSLLEYSINPDAKSLFWTNEIFILSLSTKDNYLETLSRILPMCPLDACIILMSSTSVYKEFDSLVDENTPITAAGLQREAEERVLGLRERALILRLGGLMGEDRVAGRWKSVSDFRDGPVNYIHKDDVISIIYTLIAAGIDRGIFNLVAPLHPLRSQVHQANSRKFGFELGSFTGMSRRIVSSDKLIQSLDYTFIYPDPLYFWNPSGS